ncbi:helix-turn-helix transcriptional regulator [Actinoallomurus oryzae]|uniref:Helix-turn-helix transcriptional regulator n=1 Tax=Actinoallomurus oryzae TaxID=502180 RepID=A0ABP8Q0Q2_9ACTN
MSGYAEWPGRLAGATMWRNVAAGDEQRVVPDGVMDLMWYEDRLVVAGPDTATVAVATRPGAATWGLRLPPGVAHALLGVPACELTDHRVDLADLAPVPGEALASAEDDVPVMLERVLLALWRRAAPDPSVLRLAASLDRAARGRRSVREIAADHGLSDRTLRRTGDRLFGYGLKTLMGIHRFQYALQLARTGTALSEAAATAGYFDQAHLSREARRLAGATPGALLR